MTPESEQLEAQSRAAIKAWCDDPSVQLEITPKNNIYWVNRFGAHDDNFYIHEFYYRIAKPRKFYRVGHDRDGDLILVENKSQEEKIQSLPYFERWLDERKYYD